jgi:hypothetical protein
MAVRAKVTFGQTEGAKPRRAAILRKVCGIAHAIQGVRRSGGGVSEILIALIILIALDYEMDNS